jgi:hypothetical protein
MRTRACRPSLSAGFVGAGLLQLDQLALEVGLQTGAVVGDVPGPPSRHSHRGPPQQDVADTTADNQQLSADNLNTGRQHLHLRSTDQLLTAASDDHEGVTFSDDAKSRRVHIRAG